MGGSPVGGGGGQGEPRIEVIGKIQKKNAGSGRGGGGQGGCEPKIEVIVKMQIKKK